MRFSAVIKLLDINPYVLVSATRARAIKPDWRKPMPVLVRINGKPAKPWRINMMPMGNGSFYLYLHGDVRKASATKVGDRVTADVRFDSSYRNGALHPMPRWFSSALRRQPTAQRNWRALTPSRQKEVLRYLAKLKSTEARARNLAKVMHALSGNDTRFMGRSWSAGK